MQKLDWRKAEDYERFNDIAPSKLAWEFLRRNQEYNKAWDNYVDASIAEIKKPGSSNADELCDSGTRWGLRRYINPEDDNGPNDNDWLPLAEVGLIMKVTERPRKDKGHRFIGQLEPDDEGWCPALFNIYQPIKPQIEAIRKELLQFQKKAEKLYQIQKAAKIEGKKPRYAFKPRRSEFIELLRVLDALDAKGKPKSKEIVDVLFPGIDSRDGSAGVKRVYDKREKQALRYVNKDYRLIPYSEI